VADLIAPSILSADFARLGAEVDAVLDAGADVVHFDVMDNHYVPNLTIGPPVVKSIHGVASKPLDVHLMITDPREYAEPFARAGAHNLTFHIEVCDGDQEAFDVVSTFRDAGVPRVGVALNPDTPIERVAGVLGRVDLVLVMSVFPGFGGQSFMPEVLPKLETIRKAVDSQGLDADIQIDGGITPSTIGLAREAGADVFVAGSAIFRTPDPVGAVRALRNEL